MNENCEINFGLVLGVRRKIQCHFEFLCDLLEKAQIEFLHGNCGDGPAVGGRENVCWEEVFPGDRKHAVYCVRPAGRASRFMNEKFFNKTFWRW